MADVVFAGLQITPVCSSFGSLRIKRNYLVTRSARTVLLQESLNHNLRLFVFALTENMVADASLCIGEIESRPIIIAKRAPDRMIVIDHDRVVDAHVLGGPAEVVDILFKRELGRMDADHDQTRVSIFVSPSTYIRKLTPPVDTGIGPEINQNDFSLQPSALQRL